MSALVGSVKSALKFLELARDGEFVVAEEEVDVGHDRMNDERRKRDTSTQVDKYTGTSTISLVYLCPCVRV